MPFNPDPASRDPLPSLTLPPEIPVEPEKKADTISLEPARQQRKLRRAMSVSVFLPRGADVPLTGYRTVGFFNHTAKDLSLTIEGGGKVLSAGSGSLQISPGVTAIEPRPARWCRIAAAGWMWSSGSEFEEESEWDGFRSPLRPFSPSLLPSRAGPT